jgi:hypothetical protein
MTAIYVRDLRPVKWGFEGTLHSSNPEPPMSALGHKRTLKHLYPMSGLPPKADIVPHNRNVRFVPKADSCSAAMKHYSITSSAVCWRCTGALVAWWEGELDRKKLEAGLNRQVDPSSLTAAVTTG